MNSKNYSKNGMKSSKFRQPKSMNYGRNYQLYAEKFYDLIKLNNEFREYDFKKNLEIKLHLCEQPKNWQTKKTSFPLSTNYRNCIRNSVIQVP